MSPRNRVRLLLAARPHEEAKRIIAGHPSLLEEPALDRLAEEGRRRNGRSLEPVLRAYELLAERVSAADRPELRGTLLNNLGLLYTRRSVGRLDDNVERTIVLFQEVVAILPPGHLPAIRAAALENLGNAFCDRVRGDREENLREARSYFEASLAEAPDREPADRAATLTNLGTIDLELPAGHPERDLERALRTFREALEMLSPRDHPDRWARAMTNFGNAHRERAREGSPDDLDEAIRVYRRVLRELPAASFPADWGNAQLNLAIAWIERMGDDRAQSLEKAIEACEEGLAAVPRRALPDLWARLQATLGTALDHRVRGDRADNQERAIMALRQALRIERRVSAPAAQAATEHNLANVYRERIRGSRSRNVELAIRLHRRALEGRPRETMPEEWAQTRADLAACYLQRVHGDRSDNLEEALRGCEEVLEVLDPHRQPLDWSYAMTDLAVTYLRRVRGDRAENLERAIECCHQALRVQTKERMPFEWARLLGGLAYLYTLRQKGNRAENLEDALDVLARALEVLTPEETPVEWADTLNNRGLVFLDRLRGGRSKNLEEALACFEQALSVRGREAMPRLWGMTLSNLGGVLLLRQKGDRGENIERAIAAFVEAIDELPREESPLEWAGNLSHLADAWFLRRQGDPTDNMKRAIAAGRAALQERTRRAQPLGWAETLSALGLAWQHRREGERKDNLRRAAKAFRQALQVLPIDSLPSEHRRTQRRLGNLLFEQGRWREACAAYLAAEQAAGMLYRTGVTPEGRELELGENQDLLPCTAYCLARLGRTREAVERLETWKARELAEGLARNEALLEKVPHGLEEELREAIENIRALEGEARKAGEAGRRSFPEVRQDLGAARQELDQIIERIRGIVPDFLATGLDIDGLGAIVRLLGHPLVYLVATSRGSLALLLRAAAEPSGSPALETIWIDAYKLEDLKDEIPRPGSLYRLGDELIAPLAFRLRELGARAVTLVPAGGLHLLPLHAAPYQVDGRDLCLLDELDVAQVPSGRSLAHALGRLAALRPSDRLLAVGNPLPLPEEGARPLAFAESEAQAVAQVAGGGSGLLAGAAATRAAVEERLWDTGLLHFACHGFFDPEHPLESGLLLADGESLTVRDLLDGQPLGRTARTRLAVLSACWSAMTELDRLPDESIGLPSVFLQAGIPGVVGTLWPVDDVSTALLMIRFYELHLRGDGAGPLAPAQALRRAQLWLRDVRAGELLAFFQEQRRLRAGGGPALDAAAIAAGLSRFALEEPESRPFEDPYSWASFVFVGV